jgi:hypothetical protein
MGTHSFVGMMVGNVCSAVYVHYDGYLEGVGAQLQDYAIHSDVKKLISHGDRSSLEEGYFKNRWRGCAEARGVGSRDYANFEEFFKNCCDASCEWYYIFKDGVWYCGNTYEGSKLYRTLTPYAEAGGL